MSDLKVKEIVSFKENDIRKTKLIISDSKKDTEIVLEGKGALKIAVEV